MAIRDEDYESLNQNVFNTALAAAQSEKPTYQGTYEDRLKELYDQIENREKFSYDVNADPLYQQYKDQYVQQGKMAMKDTMGQAAALTGGYGNTYAQSAGQQAYDAYLQNLSAVIPELYGMAYGQYKDEGDRLSDLYTRTGQLRDTEYGRYRDELSDYNYGQERARQAEQAEYERRINQENTEYARRTEEEERAYKKQQQAYSNLYTMILKSGYSPTDKELKDAGMTRAAANALQAEYLRSITPTSSGGGGGGGGRGGSGGGGSAYSNGYDPNILRVQQQLQAAGYNINATGQADLATRTAAESYVNRDNSAHWSTIDDRKRR